MRRPPPWSIADLVDFEYLLANDGAEPDAATRREVAARVATDGSAGDGVPTADAAGRRRVFRVWLDVCRERAGGDLPGGTVASAWRWLLLGGGWVGLCLGGTVTAGFLHYRGEVPVNVFSFLAATVGVPFGLWVAWLILGFPRVGTRVLEGFQPTRRLIVWLAGLGHAGLRRMPGERRQRLHATLGVLARRREIYGSLAAWPFLMITQVFALAFSAGVVAVLLGHVAATDLAFGWQSTLRLGPEGVYRFVSWVAAPWSGWAPNAHPSLAEIRGSRFSYVGGMADLDRGALVSWWPFLVYAVAVYGALPRLAVLGLAIVRWRAGRDRLGFDHEGCHALYRRLTGPLVTAQEGMPGLVVPAASGTEGSGPVPGQRCLALVSEEVTLVEATLRAYLARVYGRSLAELRTVRVDHPSGNAGVLEALAASGSESGRGAVVVIERARRAPIRAIALFLEKVIARAGEGSEVLLLLVGRPEGDGFAAVDPEALGHWRDFRALHGLRFELETWRTE